MNKNYYVDAVMGEWKHDKKGSTKDNLCYKRRVEVKLHKDYAMEWIDPSDFKKYKVHGDVVLTETKLIDIKTSLPSFFRKALFGGTLGNRAEESSASIQKPVPPQIIGSFPRFVMSRIARAASRWKCVTV